MDNQTFRSRLVELIQKSRKAMRLYTTMGRTLGMRGNEARGADSDTRGANEYAELQAAEWRSVNAELVKKLSSFAESPNAKKLVSDVLHFRDHLHAEFRMAEAELKSKQRDLLFAAENSDFIKAALLSRDLVSLKARTQAAQAAHHELESVIRRSKIGGGVAAPSGSIELTSEQIVDEAAQSKAPSVPSDDVGTRRAKIIPLRKASSF